MKKLLFALLFAPTFASASPYVRLIDPAHPIVSGGVLFDPRGLSNTGAVTNVALLTHSVRDGSIIPKSWQALLPPEDWVPLEIGGGYAAGDGLVNAGTSVNLAPAVAAGLLRGVSASSSAFLQGTKSALTTGYSSGGGQLAFAFGPSLVALPVKGGALLPVKDWMPGRGFGPIINNALRWQVQLAWHI